MGFPDRIQLRGLGCKAWTLVWMDWGGVRREEFPCVNRLEGRLFKLMLTRGEKEHGFTLVGIYYGYEFKIGGK